MFKLTKETLENLKKAIITDYRPVLAGPNIAFSCVGCTGSCRQSCRGGCQQSCTGSCKGSCRGGCTRSCKGNSR